MRLWGASAAEMKAFCAAEEPVVLMGRGHSGTRLLAYAVQALGVDLGFSERMASGDPEDDRFRRGLARLAQRWDKSERPRERELRRLRTLVHGWHRRLAPRGPWGWKYPETYLLVAHVHAVFPRARYLHIVRDGRDLAFKRHRTNDPATRLGRRLLRKLDALEDPGYLRAAVSWAYQVERFADFQARHLPPERVLDLTFEELCRDPVAVTGRIAAFLGVPMSESAAGFMRGFARPEKIADHRGRKPERIRAVEERIGATLRRFGYLAASQASAHPAEAPATRSAS